MEVPLVRHRVRVYYISCLIDLTPEEFDQHYKKHIRNSNARFSNCKYVIMNDTKIDTLVEEFLREIGVSPMRITIHHVVNKVPVNQYKSPILEHPLKTIRDVEMTKNSTHDILWTRVDSEDTYIQRNIMRRKEQLKKKPFSDTY